jgi:hypothetical protein
MLRKAIADALKGDSGVLRVLLDRILPARRAAPVTVGALPAGTAAEVSKASEKLVQKVASGKLTIPEGEGFQRLLEARRRSI